MELRPYEPADGAALWELKAAFERSLGGANDEKAATYEAKLTDAYRERYLAWADDCVERDPGCITLAVADGDDASGDPEPAATAAGDGEAVGYVFVLPADLAFVWDAAVVNELYLAPDYRGTGVADDLMAAAVAHARGQDLPLDRLVLDVDPENERAYAFYERCGFEPWAEMVAREL